MKIRMLILVTFVTVFLPVKSFAQLDERTPGIYAVVGDVSTPLTYSTADISVGLGSGRKIGNVSINTEVANSDLHYKGETSGVVVTDTLVLVVDLEKKNASVSAKKFNAFVSRLTPDDLIIIPLTTNHKKDRREYKQDGLISVIFGKGNPDHAHFEWEMISDNSYAIKIFDLSPGEYGVVFRLSKMSDYLYNNIFGFTVE